MLPDSVRFKLLGTYTTPAFEYGDIVADERFGEVEIVSLTDGRIPWPIGRPSDKSKPRKRAIVLYGALLDAVMRESASAVRHWWGVSPSTVRTWRRALGVERTNEGQRELYVAHFAGGVGEALARGRTPEVLASPDRRRKISEAMTGKPRPTRIAKMLRTLRKGTSASKATRAKMSESHRRRRTSPPKGPPWTS